MLSFSKIAGIFVIVSALALVAGVASGERIQLCHDVDNTNIEITSSDMEGILIDAAFPYVDITEIAADGETWHRLSVPGCVRSSVPGSPAVPAVTRLVAVPDRCRISVSIVDAQYERLDGVVVEPAPPVTLRDAVRAAAPEPDPAVYGTDGLYPAAHLSADTPAILRDYRVVPITIHPVLVNPVTGTGRALVSAAIAVEFLPGPGVNIIETPERGKSRAFSRIYESLIMNPCTEDEQDEWDVSSCLLVIVHDNFYSSILPYAAWKWEKGLPVVVTKTSEISPNPSANDIENYIQNAYDTWDPAPDYVLLVGDDDYVPVHYGIGSCPTDHKYSTVAGSDYLPDIHLGRFSVKTAAELDRVVAKNLDYELDPGLGGVTWYAKGLVMSGSDYVDDQNANKVRNILLADGYTDVTKLFSSLGNLGPSNISASYNEGDSWSAYFGHGSETSWSSPSPSYTNSHVNALTNDHRPSLITSVACSNGALDENSDCFAEAWQKQSSGSAGRGSVGIYAASRPCAFFYTDTLGVGVARGNFMEGLDTYGAACTYGKLYMYYYFPYGYGSVTEETMQQYILFGDPELLVRTGDPYYLTVVHPGAIVPGENSVTVQVSKTGGAVVGALVSLTKVDDGVQASGYTNASGSVVLNPAPDTPGILKVTVTARNSVVYQGEIEVIVPDSPWISLRDTDLDDTAGGNGDGNADYGETVSLASLVKNMGSVTAYGVAGALSSDDPEITVIDGSDSYGTVGPEEEVWGLNECSFEVASPCTDGHPAMFTFVFSDDADSSWTSTLAVILHAPDLEVSAFRIDDSVGGNGDGKLDPGETADIYVTLLNGGSGLAGEVSGVFSTVDPYITLLEDSALWPDIPGDGEAESTGPITVTADAGCPDGHVAEFTADLAAARGYAASSGFSICIGGFNDDMESGEGDWVHMIVTPGYNDEWHLSSTRNNTPGGSYSWKCGSTGSGDYSDYDDSGLVTPTLYLGDGSILEFWHWIDAELDSGVWAWDGAIVEITTNSGATWTQIAPEGGYPYKITANAASPFDPGTPCFSGSYNWQKEAFDLSAYSGEVHIRFRFGSDGYVTQEGWYIDDVLVYSAGEPLSIQVTDAPSSAAPGETISWTIEVTNSGDAAVVDYWLTAEKEGGGSVDLPIATDVSVPAGYSESHVISYTIPAGAPTGTYEVVNKLGDFPDGAVTSDSFTLQIVAVSRL